MKRNTKRSINSSRVKMTNMWRQNMPMPRQTQFVRMQESYIVIFENYLDQVPHQQIHISKESEYQTEISS